MTMILLFDSGKKNAVRIKRYWMKKNMLVIILKPHTALKPLTDTSY